MKTSEDQRQYEDIEKIAKYLATEGRDLEIMTYFFDMVNITTEHFNLAVGTCNYDAMKLILKYNYIDTTPSFIEIIDNHDCHLVKFFIDEIITESQLKEMVMIFEHGLFFNIEMFKLLLVNVDIPSIVDELIKNLNRKRHILHLTMLKHHLAKYIDLTTSLKVQL